MCGIGQCCPGLLDVPIKTHQSLVTGAKEKLAASLTRFLGCFLVGLWAGPWLRGMVGPDAGQGCSGLAAETPGEPPAGGRSLFLVGAGVSLCSP